jgi:Flp pilus assembly protein TadG
MAQRRRAGGHDREHDGERGASAVEFSLVSLPLLILIFLLVQAGLYYHAVNVAQAVAQTTARVVRTYPGQAGQVYTVVPSGEALQGTATQTAVQAWRELDANRTLVKEPAVTVTVDVGAYNQVTVTVRSEAVNLLPALLPSLPVTAKASGPIEIFKPQRTN